MAQKFTNAARSPLMANIASGDTSLTVDAALADLFPVADTGASAVPTVGKDFFKVVLQDTSGNIEIIYVRTRTLGSATFSNVMRGQEGTMARAYLAGSIVGLRYTALDLAGAIDLAGNATATGKAVLNAADAAAARLAINITTFSSFFKADTQSVVFTKTGAGNISLKAGTYVDVAGTLLTFSAATAVTMPALTAGTDYAIYACQDGTVRADASFTNPTGYTTANSRQIGGFHYGLVAAATTVAGGSFATTGNGMIWSQTNVDDIAGINKFSLWDLKFRPRCDPRGMALISNQTWVDIYLCSTDTAANGTSKYNTNIASGTVLPKIPVAFGGNGTTTYPALNWWVANELARANQKRLMWEYEFVDSAFGVTENQSIDATSSTYPTTLRNAGYTSKYGIEQASGHQWTWGQDSNFYSEVASPAGSYKDVNGNTGAAGSGRGQIYTYGTVGLTRVILGGARAYGANSGSRASYWNNFPWSSSWSVSLRAACDHLILV